MCEEFFDVMLRGKLKIWFNDMLVVLFVKKEKEVLVKKVDELVVVFSGVVEKLLDIEKSKKRNVVVFIDDVDDLEYFKSRVKKNFLDFDSDSEFGSDEDEDEVDDDDGEDDVDICIFFVDGDDDEVEEGGDEDVMEVGEEDDGKMV